MSPNEEQKKLTEEFQKLWKNINTDLTTDKTEEYLNKSGKVVYNAAKMTVGHPNMIKDILIANDILQLLSDLGLRNLVLNFLDDSVLFTLALVGCHTLTKEIREIQLSEKAKVSN